MNIPEGVTVTADRLNVTVKGPKGEVQSVLPKQTEVKLNGNKIELSSPSLAMKGTAEALIKNMIFGVMNGYSRKLKLLYAHFPITLEIKGNEVVIKNFLGEKQPRRATVVGNTKVSVKGQNVEVSGPDKHAVGQTIANLKRAMRIKDKDARIFQDGIYEIRE